MSAMPFQPLSRDVRMGCLFCAADPHFTASLIILVTVWQELQRYERRYLRHGLYAGVELAL